MSLIREVLGVGAVINNGDVGYPGGDEPQAGAGGHESGDKDGLEQVGDLAGVNVATAT